MRDAYDELFKEISRERFFEVGLNDIIFIDDRKIEIQWDNLQKSLLGENDALIYIRGYGRDAKKTNYFVELYKTIFPKANIVKDSTNNAAPTKLLGDLTGLSKSAKQISNYQVSHLFGCTKNPLLFTSAWNIAYVPKYLDPFTGHETIGEHSEAFKKLFNKMKFAKFQKYIDEYKILYTTHIAPKLDDAFEKTRKQLIVDRINIKNFEDFEKDARAELLPIEE